MAYEYALIRTFAVNFYDTIAICNSANGKWRRQLDGLIVSMGCLRIRNEASESVLSAYKRAMSGYVRDHDALKVYDHIYTSVVGSAYLVLQLGLCDYMENLPDHMFT
jgi:hypothetical protein